MVAVMIGFVLIVIFTISIFFLTFLLCASYGVVGLLTIPVGIFILVQLLTTLEKEI